MSDQKKLASDLTTSLELALSPVAIAFSDDVPRGVTAFDGAVPAGCAFWEKAAAGAFATTAKDHELCAIGMHTHNLPQTPATQSELQESLKAMAGLDYVRAEEVTGIPFVQRRAKHV